MPFILNAQIDHWESPVLAESDWQYLLPTEQPDPSWTTIGYDDSSWPTAQGGLGYGDGDDNTNLPPTLAFYMRQSFVLNDVNDIVDMIFNMDFDDGFVAYLNGVEIARVNSGNVGEVMGFDQASTGDHEAVIYAGGYPETYLLGDMLDVLVNGLNVIALEVRNSAINSSDLSALPYLHLGVESETYTFSPTPSWFVAPVEPCTDETGSEYTVILNTGSWGGEVTWGIQDFSGTNTVYSYTGFGDYTEYVQPICLVDNCYRFVMLDSYGDGWNGGVISMYDNNGILVLQGELMQGAFDYIEFSANGDCEIFGCTDPEALNYSLTANTDNGSCVVFTSTNLPLVVIDTNGDIIMDEPRITAHMGIIHNENGINTLSDPFNNYDGNIAIEIRGSSSQSFPKKNYGFETQDEFGLNNNVSLIDLPENNDWVFHGPYSDKSQIRNVLTFELGWRIGRYAPRTKMCELFINGDYKGIYVLMESVKIDQNRVDIANLLSTDIEGDELTGGYLLKIDRPNGDFDGGWESPYPNLGGGALNILFHKPEDDSLVQVQRDYIQAHITAFEDALAGPDFADPELGYAPFIDLDSFMDLYLINELSKNIDAYRLSTFLYKEKDSNGGKIFMGPWWDYNLAFGNADYCEGWNTQGWEVEGGCGAENPFWFERLLEDENYRNQLQCRWIEHRSSAWSNDSITSTIDSLSNYLEAAAIRNFARWETLGMYVWPNYYIGQTYEEEIEILRNWTIDRLEWIDMNLLGICISGCTDESACNYFPDAIADDGSCIYPEPLLDCFGNCLNDSDVDLVCDEIDNCPQLYNPDQSDLNENGVGDDCEVDAIFENLSNNGSKFIKATDLSGREVLPNAQGCVLLYFENGTVIKRVNLINQP